MKQLTRKESKKMCKNIPKKYENKDLKISNPDFEMQIFFPTLPSFSNNFRSFLSLILIQKPLQRNNLCPAQ